MSDDRIYWIWTSSLNYVLPVQFESLILSKINIDILTIFREFWDGIKWIWSTTLNYVVPAADSNLNHSADIKLQIKEGFVSVIQIWTGGRQFKFIKFGSWSLCKIKNLELFKNSKCFLWRGLRFIKYGKTQNFIRL